MATFDDLDIKTDSSRIGATVVFNDTVELTFADPLGSDAKLRGNLFCRSIHVNNVSGTLAFTYPGGTLVFNKFLNAGAQYPYMIGKFMSTGSTAALDGNIVAER